MSDPERNSERSTAPIWLALLVIAALGCTAVALAGPASSPRTARAQAAAGQVPVVIKPPKISGIAEAGAVLKASHGRWSGGSTSYLYRWKRCTAAGRECRGIAGATSRTYALSSGDVEATLRVAVTARNAAGRSRPALSAPTAIVSGGGLQRPKSLLPPEIAGLAKVGLPLVATTGSWSESPSSYRYQWLRCDAGGASCTTISGAMSASYLLGSADLGKTLRVSVTAVNTVGESAPARSAPTEVIKGSAEAKHLEYVLQGGNVYVYSIDEGFAEVESFALPETGRGVHGAGECPATGVLYVAFGSESGSGGALAYSLYTKKVLWLHTNYGSGIDSFALSKDCSKIYMPIGAGEGGGTWRILNSSTGEQEGTISTPGSGPHNTVASTDGKMLLLGTQKSSHLVIYHTESGKVQTQTATLAGGVRPLTINGAGTEAFTTATGLTGFQVSSTAAGGAIQYTENFGGSCSQSTCSHGISLSPDNREVAVVDLAHGAVQFWNVEGVERGGAPTHVATVSTTIGGEGWVQHSYDGRYVFVGDDGDVIATATHKVVAHLASLASTRQSIEVDWAGGKTIAATQRNGVGR